MRDNLLPLLKDYNYKMEYLILIANILGCYYRRQKKFKRAIYHLDQAILFLKSYKNIDLLILTFNDYASVFISLNLFQKALNFSQAALKNSLEDQSNQDHSKLISLCYNNMGVCFHALGEKEKSKSAFVYSKNFEKYLEKNLKERFKSNYNSLSHHRAHSNINTASNPNLIDKNNLNLTISNPKKENYEPIILDLYNIKNISFLLQKKEITNKDLKQIKLTKESDEDKKFQPFTKINCLNELESKGILTWEQDELLFNDSNCNNLLERLKLHEINQVKSISLHEGIFSEKKIISTTKKNNLQKEESNKKEIEKLDFMIRSQNHFPKFKSHNSNSFFESHKINLKDFEDKKIDLKDIVNESISIKSLKTSNNYSKADVESILSNSTKMIKTYSEKKSNFIEKEKDRISNNQNILKDEHLKKVNSLLDSKLYKRSKNFLEQKKDSSLKDEIILQDNSNLSVGLEKNINIMTNSHDSKELKKKNHFRKILLLHEENQSSKKIDVRSLKNSDLFRKKKAQSLFMSPTLIFNNLNYGKDSKINLKDGETQIDSICRNYEKKNMRFETSELEKKTVDDQAKLEENFDLIFNDKDMDKLKKCQRTFKKFLLKKKKIDKEQNLLKINGAIKIQNSFKIYLSKKYARSKIYKTKDNFHYFGNLFKKIFNKFYKIAVFKDKANVILKFITLSQSHLEKTIKIEASQFFEQNSLEKIDFRQKIKSKMKEIINEHYFFIPPPNKLENKENEILYIEENQNEKNDENIQSNTKINREFPSLPFVKKSYLDQVRLIQKFFKKWYYSLDKNNNYKKHFFKKIEKLGKNQFIFITCSKNFASNNICIAGKIFEKNYNFFLQRLIVNCEMVKYLKEPLKPENFWDLVSYDAEKKRFFINEFILYQNEKQNIKLPINSNEKPIHQYPKKLIIKIQKTFRRFSAQQSFLSYIKNIRKSKEILRKYKIFFNETVMIKIRHEEDVENNDKITLKGLAFIRNKNKSIPLSFEKIIQTNVCDLNQLSLNLIESLKIKKSIKNDFYIESNDVLFYNNNESQNGYDAKFMSQQFFLYELNYFPKASFLNIIQKAIAKISRAWQRFKFCTSLEFISLKHRKNSPFFSGLIFTDEKEKKLEKFKQKRELKKNSKNMEDGKVFISESFKKFSEEVIYVINISYNNMHKALVILCTFHQENRISTQFNIPISSFGLNGLGNLEDFKFLYLQKILDSLYYQNDELIQSFQNITKSLIKESDQNYNDRKSQINQENNEEKQEKNIIIKDPAISDKNNKKNPESENNIINILNFSIEKDFLKFSINFSFNITNGQILINCKEYISNKFWKEHTTSLDWFSLSDLKDKKELINIMEDSKNYLKNSLFLRKQTKLLNNLYEVSIDPIKLRKLHKILKKRLKQRKSAILLQKAWRKYMLQANYKKIIDLKKELSFLFLQIKVLKNRFFKFIYLVNYKGKNVRIYYSEISKNITVKKSQFWIIRIFDVDFNSSQILINLLKDSIIFEIVNEEVILKTNNSKLMINEKNISELNEKTIDLQKNNETHAKSNSKGSIHLCSKLFLLFKTFQSRKQFSQQRDIKNSLNKNRLIFLKSMIMKREINYLIINCFYQKEEQKVFLYFINLNRSRSINAKYYFPYHWKTYPNRVEILNLLDLVKENLYFTFVYGMVNAFLLNVEYTLVEICKTNTKRKGISAQSNKLMNFISGIMFLQKTFRKKKAKEMRDLKIQSIKLKQENISLKNIKLHSSHLTKLNQGYFRINIYQNDKNKFLINAKTVSSKNRDRNKIFKTTIEIDDSELINTDGKGIEQFLLTNLKISENKLIFEFPEKYSKLKEENYSNQQTFNINEDTQKELESPLLIKYEEKLFTNTIYDLQKKQKQESNFDNDENLEKISTIMHQEEIEGNLFNIYYQNSSQTPKIPKSSNQKTVQIDVNVEDLLSYNPTLKLNNKDSLKKVAEILTKSIKTDEKTDKIFIDRVNINPKSLKMRKVEFDKKFEISPKIDSKTIKKNANLTKYQNGIPNLIKNANENRKVILKKTKISNGKQYLIIINYLERPLKKFELIDCMNKEELFEDYEVLFEIKATFSSKETLKKYIQIELTLGEISFLCQFQNPANKSIIFKNSEYKELAEDFVEKLGVTENNFYFEIRYILNASKQNQINQLLKKFKNNNKEKLIFINVIAIKKIQLMFQNRKKNKKYQEFRNEMQKNKRVIEKKGYINKSYEIVLLLKDFNTHDFELIVWDLKKFSFRYSIYLKKQIYQNYISNSYSNKKILDSMKNYLDFSVLDDTKNKPKINIFLDEEKLIKHLTRDEKQVGGIRRREKI